MSYLTANEVFDAALNHIINNCDLMVLCENQPSSFNDANLQKGSGGLRLASIAMAPGDFTGPADGDTSGRKVTSNQKTGGAVEQAGSGNHIAYLDTANSVLLHVKRETQQATGTAQAGTTTMITLDASDAAPDGTYVGMTVRILSGTAAGEDAGIITTHAAGIINFAPAFGTAPDNTSVYEIYGVDIQTGAGNTVTFEASRIEFLDPTQA